MEEVFEDGPNYAELYQLFYLCGEVPLIPAGYAPTPLSSVRLMLDMAEVGPGDVLFDLGSGDGRVLAVAARRGARCVGLERHKHLAEQARERLRKVGAHADILIGDFMKIDLRPADVVTLALTPYIMKQLVGKLHSELRKGARITSYRFPLPSWEPIMIERDEKNYSIYLYRQP